MARTPPTTPAPTTPPVAVAPATTTASSTNTPPPQQDEMKWYFYIPLGVLLVFITWWSLDTRYANMYGVAPTTIVPMVPPLVPTGPAGPTGIPLVQVHVNEFYMVKYDPVIDPVGKVVWHSPGDPLSPNPDAWVVTLKDETSEYDNIVDINKYLAQYGLKILPGRPPTMQTPTASSSSTPALQDSTFRLSKGVEKLERKIGAAWNTP